MEDVAAQMLHMNTLMQAHMEMQQTMLQTFVHFVQRQNTPVVQPAAAASSGAILAQPAQVQAPTTSTPLAQNLPHQPVEVVVKAPSPARKLTAKELSEDVPPALKKKVQEAHAKFRTKASQAVKAQGALNHLEEDIKKMNASNTCYPPGCRPFKSNQNRVELDTVWSESKDAPKVLTITVPQASTKRSAMQIIHHSSALALKGIEREAHVGEAKNLHAMTTDAAWDGVMQKVVADFIEEGKHGIYSTADLDLKALELYATRLLQEGKEQEARNALKRQAKLQADQTKKELRAKELAETAPAALLSRFVEEKIKASRGELPADALHLEADQVVSAMGKGKGTKGWKSKSSKQPSPHPDHQQEQKKGGAKNEQGWGQPKNPKGKGKGQAKGKNAGENGYNNGGSKNTPKGGKGKPKSSWA